MRRFAELMVTFWRAAAEAERGRARRAPDHVHYPLPTTAEITAGIERPTTLRLRISRGRLVGAWHWRIIDENAWWHDSGQAASQPEALAVGLAALDAAHARTRR